MLNFGKKMFYCQNLVTFVKKSIIADSLKIEKLKNQFSNKNQFSSDDLFNFYSEDWSITKSTLNWRIYKLIKMGVLQRVGKGTYSLGKEVIFYPEISRSVKKLFKSINNNFPFANSYIWHTSSLNRFMRHQPAKYQLMIDVEKDASESVFYFIKEKYKNVFLNPNEEIYYNYITGKKECIIITNLISEAPTHEIYDVNTVTIEKILVDIFCEPIIYSAFQGKEMDNIYFNAFKEYTINITTLLRYAQRRGKKNEIEQYIFNNTSLKKDTSNTR